MAVIEPPTGIVTFLFTDIEGSNRRWEQYPEVMREAVARHDRILRDAIEDHGGYVFKTVGDAFCATFRSASDGLAAALASQSALCAEPWSADCVIRVRMGLHTGSAQERDGDYFGPPVNRAARLMSAAHGGQVLLSGSTRQLCDEMLVDGLEVRDMGEHRLKDLSTPEHIFQVVMPDLPSEFPALGTLDARANNLPVEQTAFIGRDVEVTEVMELLRRPDVRLMTLCGPGGMGKTRLALQVAAELLEEYTSGVYFVPLAGISDARLVASEVAKALSLLESPGQALADMLKDHLRTKELLLVLDNFEHVMEAEALVADLVTSCPKLTILVTSRVVLHVYGARDYQIPSLRLPDPRHLPRVEELETYDAIRFFVERALAVKSDFVVTAENALAVVHICHRLDGLPLALELAAARIRLLPPQAMLTRLSSRLKLLTGGARNLDARQQTLRNTIDWSYGLLDAAEQALFARLAVFAGGCTLEAAGAVCNSAEDMPIDVFDGIASLLEKSLLRQEEGPDGEPRFSMLETLREYGRERLRDSGETETVCPLHAEFFQTLAVDAVPHLRGPAQTEWLERLDTEHDNLRSVLAWAIDDVHENTALSLTNALNRFWYLHGHITEARDWYERTLPMAVDAAPELRSQCLNSAGMFAALQHDQAAAEAHYQDALTLAGAVATRKPWLHASIIWGCSPQVCTTLLPRQRISKSASTSSRC